MFYPGHWTLLKNGLVADIAKSSQALTARGRMVAVFLNGENWGIYYLRERVDDDFLVAHFDTDQFELLKGNTTVDLDVEMGSSAHWNDTFDFFENSSFSSDWNYQKAQEYINIDSFIDYQIIGSFIGDHDWPHNNFYMLRELAGDTRWRWMFWDSDHAFANNYQEDVTLNSIEWITRSYVRPDLKLFGSEDDVKYLWGTLMLRRLLENVEFKQKFITRYADLLNTLLNEQNLSRRVDSLKNVLSPNIYKEYDKWSAFTHKNASPYWGNNTSFLREYVNTRQAIIRDYLNTHFSLRGARTLSIDVSGGGTLKVNTISPDSLPWSGKYFSAYPVILKAKAKPGSEFLGWSDPSLPGRDSIAVTLNSDYSITALFSDEVFQQQIDLKPGWNTFSLSIAPNSDYDLLAVLSPIQAHLLKVIDENGATVEKVFGTWQNYIGDWQPTEGYMLKADSAVTLSLYGYDIQKPFDIPLHDGWNIISYVCRDNKQDAMQLFDELMANDVLVKVIDRKGQTLEQLFGIWHNYIGNVKPNEGLKVKVNRACTLTQTCDNASLAKDMIVLQPTLFQMNDVLSFEQMHIYFDNFFINSRELEAGDEIAVFDGDQLVGASVVQTDANLPLLVVAHKNDGDHKGFFENHPVSVRVWRKNLNDVVRIDDAQIECYDTNGQRNEDLRTFQSLSSAVYKINVIDEALDIAPTDVVLYQNYPNPFNPRTTISFSIPQKSVVTLQIYDVRGVLIRELVSGDKDAGYHTVQWDGNDGRGIPVSAGIYVCRLLNDQVQQTRKLVYVK